MRIESDIMWAHIPSTKLLGRAPVLSVIAVLGALSFSAVEAQAGVILPWAQEGAAADFSLPLEGAGSSSAPEKPVSDSQKQRESDHKQLTGMVSFDGLAETGGATSPVSNAPGPAASPVGTVLAAPASPPGACSFRYLREQRLQLPQPPLGELLDPPKACV
jgi:hypothetical protein